MDLLKDNPYEKAEEPETKLREDLNELERDYFEKGKTSRPWFAERLATISQQYAEFANNTHRTADRSCENPDCEEKDQRLVKVIKETGENKFWCRTCRNQFENRLAVAKGVL